MEEIKVTGAQLVETVKKLINEGNIRRVTVKNRDGKVVFEIPLTFGVIGIALAPVLAALGAVAGLLSECTIAVERDPEAGEPGTPAPTTVLIQDAEPVQNEASE